MVNIATAAQAANYIIIHYAALGITNLKLQKLLYLCQAQCLLEYAQPLFADTIYKWRYGPSVPYVYQKFHKYLAGNIGRPTGGNVLENKEAQRIVDTVMSQYGHKEQWELYRIIMNGASWAYLDIDERIPLKAIKMPQKEHNR